MCENCYCIHIRPIRIINERAFTFARIEFISTNSDCILLFLCVLCVCVIVFEWMCMFFFSYSISFPFVLYFSSLVLRLFLFRCFANSFSNFYFISLHFISLFIQCAISPSYFARAFAPSVFLCIAVGGSWLYGWFFFIQFFFLSFSFNSPFTSPCIAFQYINSIETTLNSKMFTIYTELRCVRWWLF